MSEFVCSTTVGEMIDAFGLQVLCMPENGRDILIHTSDLNRPGMQFVSDYYEHFDAKRIQVVGRQEVSYLHTASDDRIRTIADLLFAQKIPAMIVSRNLDIPEAFVEHARNSGIPLLRSGKSTSDLIGELMPWLRLALAPQITRHGVLVEVYGEGILMLGESGIGKSETAIELLKRGHRLVADDAVEIKKVSAISLVGSAPDIIRHFVELRGIGIVDVQHIFGMGAVKDTEKIDLIIHVESWTAETEYDRLGDANETTEILGIKIPSIRVPVRPGRNLAVIVEVAAMNHRQRKMGYNAMDELNERLNKSMNL